MAKQQNESLTAIWQQQQQQQLQQKQQKLLGKLWQCVWSSKTGKALVGRLRKLQISNHTKTVGYIQQKGGGNGLLGVRAVIN